MAREIESVHRWTEDPTYGLTKERTVVRCDDGYIYEFAQAIDEPYAKLVRGFDDDGAMSHVNRSPRLPNAVKETADSLFSRWSK